MKTDLLTAMKARRKIDVAALRSALAAIDNAEAVDAGQSTGPVYGRSADVPRKVLTEAHMRNVLRTELEERRSAIAEYERLGQREEAERLRTELDILSRYL